MTERDFLRELGKSSEKVQGLFWYKIPDMPRVKGLRFNLPRPCDVIAVYQGAALAIEAKMLHHPSVYPSILRPNQVESLTHAHRCGLCTLLALNFRFYPGPRQEEVYGKKYVNQAFLVPYPSAWRIMCRRGSYSLCDLQRWVKRQDVPHLEVAPGMLVQEISWVKGEGWDLKTALEKIRKGC